MLKIETTEGQKRGTEEMDTEPNDQENESYYRPPSGYERKRARLSRPLTYVDSKFAFSKRAKVSHEINTGAALPLSLPGEVLKILEAAVRLIVKLVYHTRICVLNFTCENVTVNLLHGADAEAAMASLVNIDPECIVFLDDANDCDDATSWWVGYDMDMRQAYSVYLMMHIFTHSLAANLTSTMSGHVASHRELYDQAWRYVRYHLGPANFVSHSWLPFKLPNLLAQSTQHYLNEKRNESDKELKQLLFEGCWTQEEGQITLPQTPAASTSPRIVVSFPEITAPIGDVNTEIWRLYYEWRRQSPESPHTNQALHVFLTSHMPPPSASDCHLHEPTTVSSTKTPIQMRHVLHVAYELWRRASYSFMLVDQQTTFNDLYRHFLETQHAAWRREYGVQNWLASQLPSWSLEMTAKYDIQGYAPAYFLEWMKKRWQDHPPKEPMTHDEALEEFLRPKLESAWSLEHPLKEWFSRQEWTKKGKWQEQLKVLTYDDDPYNSILKLCQAVIETDNDCATINNEIMTITKNVQSREYIQKLQLIVARRIRFWFDSFQWTHWHTFSQWLMAQPWAQAVSFHTWLEKTTEQLDNELDKELATAGNSELTLNQTQQLWFLWKRSPYRFMCTSVEQALAAFESLWSCLQTILASINVTHNLESLDVLPDMMQTCAFDAITCQVRVVRLHDASTWTERMLLWGLNRDYLRVPVIFQIQGDYRNLTDLLLAASRRVENHVDTYKHLSEKIHHLFQCWSSHFTVRDVLKDCGAWYPWLELPEPKLKHLTGPLVETSLIQGARAQGIPESILDIAQEFWSWDKLNKRDLTGNLQHQIQVLTRPLLSNLISSCFLDANDRDRLNHIVTQMREWHALDLLANTLQEYTKETLTLEQSQERFSTSMSNEAILEHVWTHVERNKVTKLFDDMEQRWLDVKSRLLLMVAQMRKHNIKERSFDQIAKILQEHTEPTLTWKQPRGGLDTFMSNEEFSKWVYKTLGHDRASALVRTMEVLPLYVKDRLHYIVARMREVYTFDQIANILKKHTRKNILRTVTSQEDFDVSMSNKVFSNNIFENLGHDQVITFVRALEKWWLHVNRVKGQLYPVLDQMRASYAPNHTANSHQEHTTTDDVNIRDRLTHIVAQMRDWYTLDQIAEKLEAHAERPRRGFDTSMPNEDFTTWVYENLDHDRVLTSVKAMEQWWLHIKARFTYIVDEMQEFYTFDQIANIFQGHTEQNISHTHPRKGFTSSTKTNDFTKWVYEALGHDKALKCVEAVEQWWSYVKHVKDQLNPVLAKMRMPQSHHQIALFFLGNTTNNVEFFKGVYQKDDAALELVKAVVREWSHFRHVMDVLSPIVAQMRRWYTLKQIAFILLKYAKQNPSWPPKGLEGFGGSMSNEEFSKWAYESLKRENALTTIKVMEQWWSLTFPLDSLLAPAASIDVIDDAQSVKSHLFQTLCWSLSQIYSLHASRLLWNMLCHHGVLEPSDPARRIADVLPGRSPPPSSRPQSEPIIEYAPRQVTEKLWRATRYRWVTDVIRILVQDPLLTFSHLCHGLFNIFQARRDAGCRDMWKSFCSQVRNLVVNAVVEKERRAQNLGNNPMTLDYRPMDLDDEPDPRPMPPPQSPDDKLMAPDDEPHYKLSSDDEPDYEPMTLSDEPRDEAMSPNSESMSPRYESASPDFEVMSPHYESVSLGYEPSVSLGDESPRNEPGDDAIVYDDQTDVGIIAPRQETFGPETWRQYLEYLKRAVELERRFAPESTIFADMLANEGVENVDAHAREDAHTCEDAPIPTVQRRAIPKTRPLWTKRTKDQPSTDYQVFHRRHLKDTREREDDEYHKNVKEIEETLWDIWARTSNYDELLDAVRAQPFNAPTKVPVNTLPPLGHIFYTEQDPDISVLRRQCKAWNIRKPTQFVSTQKFFLQDRCQEPTFMQDQTYWSDLFTGRATLNLHLEQILDPTEVPSKDFFITKTPPDPSLPPGIDLAYPAELDQSTPHVNYVLRRSKSAPFLIQSISRDPDIWDQCFQTLHRDQDMLRQLKLHGSVVDRSSFSPWPFQQAFNEMARQLPSLRQLYLFLTGDPGLVDRQQSFLIKDPGTETKETGTTTVSMQAPLDAFEQFLFHEAPDATGVATAFVSATEPPTLFSWHPAFPPFQPPPPGDDAAPTSAARLG